MIDWSRKETPATRAAAEAARPESVEALRDEMLDHIAAGRTVPAALRARWTAARSTQPVRE